MDVTPLLLKAELSMLSEDPPQRTDTEVKLEQVSKATASMLVTEAGIVMLPVSPESRKALSPIVVS